jgi:hypothetical protein
MEEVSWEEKIIGVAICIAGIILLATGGKMMEKLRGSSKLGKKK